MRALSAGSGGRGRRAPEEDLAESLGMTGALEDGGQPRERRPESPVEGRRSRQPVVAGCPLPPPDPPGALQPGVERRARPPPHPVPGGPDARNAPAPPIAGGPAPP